MIPTCTWYKYKFNAFENSKFIYYHRNKKKTLNVDENFQSMHYSEA